MYVAGYEFGEGIPVGKLWKNGVSVPVVGTSTRSELLSVTVSGQDVYVAGYESNGAKRVAKIWKNGVATVLSDGVQDAYVSEVLVVDNDVYAAGGLNNYNDLTMWKNGVPTKLNTSSDFNSEGVWLFVTRE